MLAGPDGLGREAKQADIFGLAETVQITRVNLDEELLHKAISAPCLKLSITTGGI